MSSDLFFWISISRALVCELVPRSCRGWRSVIAALLPA